MRVIRELQERTGGITEFVPLSFIPYNTLLGRTHGVEEIEAEDNLKHTAAFRLALGKTIPNLQASWVKMGLDAATESLRWGVNDLGGTLMEENISRMAGSQPRRPARARAADRRRPRRRPHARPADDALRDRRDLLRRQEMGSRTGSAGASIAVAVLATLGLAASAQAKGVAFVTGNGNLVDPEIIGGDGGLTPGTAVPTGMITARGIAVTPDAKHVYTTGAGGFVAGFNNADGTLTPVTDSPYNVTDTGGYGIAITPDGRFLYGMNENGGAGTASIFSINADGSLTQVDANPGAPLTFPLTYQPEGVAISTDGLHLYITDSTNNTVHSYDITAGGTLISTGTAPATGTNPKGIAVSPDGRFVFTASTAGTGDIKVYPIGSRTARSRLAANTRVHQRGLPRGGRGHAGRTGSCTARISLAATDGARRTRSARRGALTPVPGQSFRRGRQLTRTASDAAPNGFRYIGIDIGGHVSRAKRTMPSRGCRTGR